MDETEFELQYQAVKRMLESGQIKVVMTIHDPLDPLLPPIHLIRPTKEHTPSVLLPPED